MARAAQVIVTSLVIVTALFVGLTIMDDLVSARDQSGAAQPVDRAEARLAGTGQFVDVADGDAGTNETVFQTTGFAANFSGAPDTGLNGAGYELGDEQSWHVSVWARPDPGTGADTMTVTSISDGEIIVYYNGTASEWAAFYYDASDRESYEASVAAQNPVQNYTNIQVLSNGTDMTIYRNTTAGGTADLTTDGDADSPTEAGPWDGRVEELRVFEEAVDSANRSELYTQPTEQQPDLDRGLRVMFDQPDRSETLLLIAGGEATPTNTSFSAGFPEDRMQVKNLTNDLAGESDYRFRRDGPEIAPVDGGELDGAPVAYVDYGAFGSGVSLVALMDSWVQLAALVPLVLIATVIVGRVRQ